MPLARSVEAATFTVDTLADTTGTGCPVGNCTLRKAIAAAAPGDTITFSVTGTITLTNGPLLINKSLTISGPGAGSLTVNGNNVTQVFNIGTTTASTVAISGLTIRGGTTGSTGGGLLVAAGSTVTLSNAVVTNNSAQSGGGISNLGSLTLNGVTISSNTAQGTGANGGGIFNPGTLNGTDIVLSGNTAGTGSGGGLTATGTASLLGAAILNNSAAQGGGVFFSATGAATLTIQDSTLGNNTTTGDGSALFAAAGTVTLNSDTIANNTAGAGLGAIFSGSSFGGALVNLRNDILAGNSGPNTSPPGGLLPRFGDQGFNDSSDSNPPFTDPTSQNNTNPQLGPLGPCGNGQAFFPLTGSPVIGTGSSGLTRDQCGTTRVAPDTKGAVFVTISVVLSNTPTATVTATRTATATPTATPFVVVAPSNTPTSTAIPSNTPTSTPTATATSSVPLQVTKTGTLGGGSRTGPNYLPYQGVKYTITIKNVGSTRIDELFGTDSAAFPHTSFGSTGGYLVSADASILVGPFPLFQGIELDDDGQGFTFRLGSLAPGATLTIEVNAVAFTFGTVTNTITVQAQGLSQPVSDSATVTVPAAGFTAQAPPPGGAPCTPPANCPIQGGAKGNWQGGGSGLFTVQATAPAGTAIGSLPLITLVTTAGIETRPCRVLTASLQATCTGTTVGNLLQGTTVAVLFTSPAGVITSVTGTVIAPSAGAPGVGASSTTLIIPPLLPPLLPPPPLPLLSPPPPFMLLPPVDLGSAAPEVPVIPEAPAIALLLPALLGLGALAFRRRR